MTARDPAGQALVASDEARSDLHPTGIDPSRFRLRIVWNGTLVRGWQVLRGGVPTSGLFDDQRDAQAAMNEFRAEAIAAAARQGGDVKQAPGEAPQSGHDSGIAQGGPPTEAMWSRVRGALNAVFDEYPVAGFAAGSDIRDDLTDAALRAMVTASSPVDHGRVAKLEAALEANAVALNAFIECVGHKMADSEHYRWCRFPTFAEVQDAMIANNAARAALTNKDTEPC